MSSSEVWVSSATSFVVLQSSGGPIPSASWPLSGVEMGFSYVLGILQGYLLARIDGLIKNGKPSEEASCKQP